MRFLALSLAVAASLRAGVIKGVVLEYASGKPLARTLVRLEPVASPQAVLKPLAVRAGRAGEFSLHSVPPGLYRLLTARTGFFPLEFGQRRPAGFGTPVQVTADSELFTELRMRRMGAITGSVFDENGIGMPGIEVLAYRASLPLRIVGRGSSDDRGVYRITGLDAGKYWVRSAAGVLEDGTGLLPTFSPQGREIRYARVYETRLDADTTDANVHPDPGALHSLSGPVQCDRPDAAKVTITVSSETGRRTIEAVCHSEYRVEGLAPAQYEVFATYSDHPGSGFDETPVRRNLVLPIQLTAPPQVDFEVRHAGTGAILTGVAAVTGRRQDLSGMNPAHPIPVPRAMLHAGHWEMNATAGPDHYVESIAASSRDGRRNRPDRPPEWHDIFLDQRVPARIRISVSGKAAHLTGAVTNDGKTIPGAPVFLWPETDDLRRLTGGARFTLSDSDGRYRFDGLPPGKYRLLATFDHREIDGSILDEARAPQISIEPAQRANFDAPLWLAP